MKQDVQSLIDRLADKSLTPGMRVRRNAVEGTLLMKVRDKDELGDAMFYVYYDDGSVLTEYLHHLKILGHDILLDTVLKHMWKNWKGTYNDKVLELIDLWGKCDFKALQEIFSKVRWESTIEMGRLLVKGGGYPIQVPVQPNARQFFSFLLSLGL